MGGVRERDSRGIPEISTMRAIRGLLGLLIGALIGFLLGIAIAYGRYYYSAWMNPQNADHLREVAGMEKFFLVPICTVFGAASGLAWGRKNRR